MTKRLNVSYLSEIFDCVGVKIFFKVVRLFMPEGKIHLLVSYSMINCTCSPGGIHCCFDAAILTATIGSQFFFNPTNTFRMRKIVPIAIISKSIHDIVDLSLATAWNSIVDNINCFHRWSCEIIIHGFFNAGKLVQMTVNRFTRTVSGESSIDKLE